MIGQSLLYERREQLFEALKTGLNNCRPHSSAFVLRVLSPPHLQLLQAKGVNYSTPIDRTQYGGYPEVASLGYLFASSGTDQHLSARFLNGIQRLKTRDSQANRLFFLDDVAVLGVADGLSLLPAATDERMWLLDGIEHVAAHSQWTSRMRSLATDLIDNRGKLRVGITGDSVDVSALEIVLRHVWRSPFSSISALSGDVISRTLKQLLSNTPPNTEELERVVIWLEALEHIIDVASQELIPTISDTARILRNVEHSFKRWKWEHQPRQGAAFASQWLVDNEYDVQSLLWAILYPIYGAELVDESYLPNWGQTQPRADLGIQKLKLIIEVKFLRDLSDFQKVEGEIGNDLGLYFKDIDLFDRMIIFIYDDCDKHQPQKYDGLRNALLKRERIEDVIIVRRPGMLPSRSERRKRQPKKSLN